MKAAWGKGLAFVPFVNLIATPILLGGKTDKFLHFSEMPSFNTEGAASSREVADELFKQGSNLAAQRNTVEDEMNKVILATAT